MRSGRERFEGSLDRALRLKLDSTIQELDRNASERKASPKQIDRRRRDLLGKYADPTVANRQLERILKGNDLTDVAYLMRGLVAARSVCRVVIKQRGRLLGYGTGFLVAPNVLMTNEHVLTTPLEVEGSVAEFEYERDLDGNERRPKSFALLAQPAPLICKELDFTLCAVSPTSASGTGLSDFGWLKLKGNPGKAFVGEYLTIIQHPGGEPKQICVRENRLLRNDDNSPYLWYQTDTTGGSSGSPVFNNEWDVVGLHHSSVPRTKLHQGKQTWFAINGEPWTSDMGDDRIDWLANEGIRASRIVDYLRSQAPAHPLARAVLEAAESPRSGGFGLEGAWDNRVTTSWSEDGVMRVRVPIELGVRLGVGLGPGAGPSDGRSAPGANASASVPGAVAPMVVEKVVIDQSNYPKRNGYQSNFLGAGANVKLPTLAAKARRDLLKAELKYWNYSVLFNVKRKLAVVSAANVDPGEWRGNRDAEGDTWFNDTRVPDAQQVGKSFYKKQATFEADRSKNPFDQGHLTRRKDVQWGSDEAHAKRSGDDSYHYTNCAPQHWAFNQNNKAHGIWFRLEELAAEAAKGERFCVFNGPIFDAPSSKDGPDGLLRLAPKGKRVKDGVFGGVSIPKQFFKVFVYRQGKKLRHAAFVVTQEDLLATIDRFQPAERKGALLSDLELQLYQVPLATVEHLTGLNFVGLGAEDDALSGAEESARALDGAPIEEADQVHF